MSEPTVRVYDVLSGTLTPTPVRELDHGMLCVNFDATHGPVFVTRDQFHEFAEATGYTGGLPFTVGDHLHQIKLAEEHGMTLQQLADALHVPVDYLQALKAGTGEE
jgi:hypothetical protein